MFALIGVLAVSSVYVTESNDATMKAAGIQTVPGQPSREILSLKTKM
jgi:hypothetical protein